MSEGAQTGQSTGVAPKAGGPKLFPGRSKCERVRKWQKANPGYWKNTARWRNRTLPDTCSTQPVLFQQVRCLADSKGADGGSFGWLSHIWEFSKSFLLEVDYFLLTAHKYPEQKMRVETAVERPILCIDSSVEYFILNSIRSLTGDTTDLV
jgi:hypothetical protein